MSHTQFMPHIPLEAKKTLHILQESLAGSLVAVYLHGSAVSSGLRPSSDVDLLAVISHSLRQDIRVQLVKQLMEISGNPAENGSIRPVELIIFLSEDLTAAQYPTRCEFIYGEWLRSDFEAGEVPQSLYDPEFTLVLAQAHQKAQTLLGPETEEFLRPISYKDVRRAIIDVLPSLLATLEYDARNVLLTLARMLRTVSCGDFVSKDFAAQWVASQLPKEEADVLSIAREEYLGVSKNSLAACRQKVQETANVVYKLIEKGLA